MKRPDSRKKSPASPAAPLPLTFVPGGEATVEAGESILNAAWRKNLPLQAPCGGGGWCGRCRVRVEPASPPTAAERKTLSAEGIGAGWRLACRTVPTAPATVTLPAGDPAAPGPPLGGGILSALGPRRRRRGLGVALDIGTTTLAAQLWNLTPPRLLRSATIRNPQSSFGSDIISRIAASSGPAGTERLTASLRRGVSALLDKLLGEASRSSREVTRIALAGNTTMQHFFAGADPAPLARAPFRPVFLAPAPRPASSCGLPGLPRATVAFVPGASAFVGGDLVAGVLALRRLSEERPALLIDMGTNAEIALVRRRSVLATSAAAGPALEGGNLSHGLPAMPGAIEEVGFDGDLVLGTLGNAPPRGLCGSGLVDAVALLLRFGLLTPGGRLLKREEARSGPWPKLSRRLGAREARFTLHRGRAPHGSVILTQDDIRQVQLAVSAIRTGWQLLLREQRLDGREISRVFIAGGFGYGLRPGSLADLGIILPAWEKKVSFPGNTALSGAALFLLDPDAEKGAAALRRAVKTRHLALSGLFRDLFIENLDFPQR